MLKQAHYWEIMEWMSVHQNFICTTNDLVSQCGGCQFFQVVVLDMEIYVGVQYILQNRSNPDVMIRFFKETCSQIELNKGTFKTAEIKSVCGMAVDS